MTQGCTKLCFLQHPPTHTPRFLPSLIQQYFCLFVFRWYISISSFQIDSNVLTQPWLAPALPFYTSIHLSPPWQNVAHGQALPTSHLPVKVLANPEPQAILSDSLMQSRTSLLRPLGSSWGSQAVLCDHLMIWSHLPANLTVYCANQEVVRRR